MSRASFPPLNLTAEILRWSQHSELLVMRLVSRSVKRLVTPLAFHSLAICFGEQGFKRLAEMQNDRELSSCVRKLVMYHKDNEPLSNDMYEGMNDKGSSVIADTFSQLLKRLFKLRELDLEFPAQFTEDDYSPRSGDFQSPALQFQWAVLDSLGQSESSPSLSHISLRNVTPWSVYSARQFTLPNILRHITHFSLTVKSSDTSQHYTCPSLDHAAFWDPLDFLVALNPDNVVSICLENDFAGISIEIPKEIRFPLLTHLKMDGFCFWSKGTLSDFIVRHGGSLESLDLDGCYVFVDEKGHQTWADLYQVFQGCLKNLQSFSTTFGSTGYLRMDAMDLSHYDAFDDELDSTTLKEDEILDDEESYAFIHQRDKQVLRLFLQAIDAQRASLINGADR